MAFSILTRKTPMEKLTAERSKQMARAKLLDRDRTTAQIAYDRAVEARDLNMLDGDLGNEVVKKKLKDAVINAKTDLDGFARPLATLAESIAKLDTEIHAEQIAADRKQAADKLTMQTDLIAKQIGPWLALTRELAASTAAVGAAVFESGQVSGYLRNAASEIEAAVTVSLDNLRSAAAGIVSGKFGIPQEPGVTQPAKPTPTPAPTTERLFLTQPLAWYDADGTKNRAPAMHDANLPLHLVGKAKALGAAHDLKSDIRSKNHGSKTSAPPAWEHSKWLNDDPKSAAEPILHSAFEKHPNVRPAYTLRQPQTGPATRSLPPGKK
jgi:hypothetical protein